MKSLLRYKRTRRYNISNPDRWTRQTGYMDWSAGGRRCWWNCRTKGKVVAYIGNSQLRPGLYFQFREMVLNTIINRLLGGKRD